MTDTRLAELTGLAQGMLADGALNDAEIRFLQGWLSASDSTRADPRIVGLLRRINEVLADGTIDDDERADLHDTLAALGAGGLDPATLDPAADLPLTSPAPELVFAGRRYCFTGTFGYGGRKSCEALSIERGANCGGLTPETDYLVVGSYAARNWSGSGFARKIAQAHQWAAEGHPIAIIAEQHWADSLGLED